MRFEKIRFTSSLCVIISFAIVNQLIAICFQRITFPFIFRFISVFSTIILFYWFQIYGAWISRNRRAVFNEQNVLETYQPRAMTHGHLFAPDPPTPVPGTEASEKEKCKFAKARDEHYRNEFVMAQRMATEREVCKLPAPKTESMRIEFEDPEEDSTSPTSGSARSSRSNLGPSTRL